MKRVALVAMLVPSLLSAQIPELIPGSRLRVRTRYGILRGTFVSQTPIVLVVTEPGGASRPLLADIIEQIDRSNGLTRRAGARKGARIGGIIGSVLAAVYVVATQANKIVQDTSATPVPEGSPLVGRALTGAVVGVVVGASGGAFVGSRRRAEEWREVYSVRTP